MKSNGKCAPQKGGRGRTIKGRTATALQEENVFFRGECLRSSTISRQFFVACFVRVGSWTKQEM